MTQWKAFRLAGDTKWTKVWLRIWPVIGQLTLQAKAIQTPEELCQAAPNPVTPGYPASLLSYSMFRFLQKYPNRHHSHWWPSVLENKKLIPVDNICMFKHFQRTSPLSRSCCWLFMDFAFLYPVRFIATPSLQGLYYFMRYFCIPSSSHLVLISLLHSWLTIVIIIIIIIVIIIIL